MHTGCFLLLLLLLGCCCFGFCCSFLLLFLFGGGGGHVLIGLCNVIWVLGLRNMFLKRGVFKEDLKELTEAE